MLESYYPLIIMVILFFIIKSWFDCGSDHDEGGLTYPGDEKE